MNSDLEDKLAFQLTAMGIPFDREVRVIPGRQFRFDFAITGTKYLVEVNGSTWVSNTGHTSGAGLIRDYEKGNLAEVLGYHVLTFTAGMVNSGEALRVIEEARRKC